jgi:hypothetical protein
VADDPAVLGLREPEGGCREPHGRRGQLAARASRIARHTRSAVSGMSR